MRRSFRLFECRVLRSSGIRARKTRTRPGSRLPTTTAGTSAPLGVRSTATVPAHAVTTALLSCFGASTASMILHASGDGPALAGTSTMGAAAPPAVTAAAAFAASAAMCDGARRAAAATS